MNRQLLKWFSRCCVNDNDNDDDDAADEDERDEGIDDSYDCYQWYSRVLI